MPNCRGAIRLKIKQDFVTNSSSTSYAVIANLTGKLPTLSDNYKKLEGIYDSTFLYENFGWFKIKKEFDEHIYYGCEQKSFDAEISMKNTIVWDDIKDDHNLPITVFQMTLENMNPYDFSTEEITSEIIDQLFFKDLKIENLDACQLVYVSYPTRIDGDGWDGGDPQGPSEYHYIQDLYVAESKIGIVSIVDKKIIADLGTIESPVKINQSILDSMNSCGIKLEE
jgi:hypothetical protein